MNRLTTALALSAAAIFVGDAAHADILLSTTLDGTTTSSKTLSGITYSTETGLDGDATITGSDNLFTTNQGSTAGHYAPNKQINSSQWDVDLGFSVVGDPVQIDSIQIERQNFNVAAAFNSATGKTYPIIVTLFGSTSGQVGSSVLIDVDSDFTNSVETFGFGGVEITSAETWWFNVQFNDGTGTNGGVYAGIDGYTINGTVVPEPGSLALLALGSLCFSRRRRG